MIGKIANLVNKIHDKEITKSDANKEFLILFNSKNLLPNKDLLLTLFHDFFTYHNEANKGFKGIDDLFNTWYNWKTLENSELDKPIKF